VNAEPDRAHVRLAELVAALSLGIDLGFGQPMEHVLRQCLIALRLAELLDLDDQTRSDTYYTALLINVGCHTDAHEQAKWFGDDLTLKSTKYDYEMGSLRGAVAAFSGIGRGSPVMQRFRIGLEFAVSGHRDMDGMVEAHAERARMLGEQLGLSEGVLTALVASYEQWDGKGWPGELKGEEIPLAARLAQLAEFVEVAYRLGGKAGARDMAGKRSGSQFDPNLAALVRDASDEVFEGLETVGNWDAVIGAEPALAIVLSGEGFDGALGAIANFVDVKSPFVLGHSLAVADLVAEAGRVLNLSAAEVRTLRRAGLVHDFGRLGVSNAIWDKPGPLGAGEWERVRLHPHYMERMLTGSEALAPLAAVAVQHAERLDGSGYPRGLSGAAISQPGRLLAAADAYQAMTERRPHRDALSAADAAEELRAEVKAGRMDAVAVDAVLVAAGHRVPRRREGPAGLTQREVEVLRLLAQGFSNKEIGEQLVISPKTAGTHVEHIYAKIDASSRATASLFALQHGLLPDVEYAPSSKAA
jgi:HD-GYP domain-containing protein (c-di-GMP phosphodiesterase class II)